MSSDDFLLPNWNRASAHLRNMVIRTSDRMKVGVATMILLLASPVLASEWNFISPTEFNQRLHDREATMAACRSSRALKLLSESADGSESHRSEYWDPSSRQLIVTYR